MRKRPTASSFRASARYFRMTIRRGRKPLPEAKAWQELVRAGLILDIAFDDFKGGAATSDKGVRGRP